MSRASRRFCTSCCKQFTNVSEQKLHYKSEWHRYNLIRRISGTVGVTEAQFQAKQLAEETEKHNESSMLYNCAVCSKSYKSSKTCAQHLNSKTHLLRASDDPQIDNPIIRPLPREDVDIGDSVKTECHASEDEQDPTRCFMCDLKNPTLEACIGHMHKKHGFFIPDAEYLTDVEGLLSYLGLKVRRDFMCLYCNGRCQPFRSLEAVRKHMDAKGHCKLRYGDGVDDHDEALELKVFYDCSSCYEEVNDNYIENGVETGCGGSELILKRRSGGKVYAKTLGSREFIRYYKQNPRPTPTNASVISIVLASTNHRSMDLGLTAAQLKDRHIRLKLLKSARRNRIIGC